MKNLIYSYCFGDTLFFEMEQVMIDSARKEGFTGDIVVLTDKPYKFVGATGYPIKMSDRKLWKCQLAQAVNPEDYDSIFYLDADQVVIRDITPLMDSGKVRIATTGFLLGGATITNSFFTLKEKNRFGNYMSICSGDVCFPGSIGRSFLSKWEARWNSLPLENAPDVYNGRATKQHWDEAALATLCFREEIEWDYLPMETMSFPPFKGIEKAYIAHFLPTTFGYTPMAVLFAMRIFSDLSKREMAIKGFSEGFPKTIEQSLNDLGENIIKAFVTLTRRIEELEIQVANQNFDKQEAESAIQVS